MPARWNASTVFRSGAWNARWWRPVNVPCAASLSAVDRLLTTHPELRGRVVFVQVGVPSRSKLESYASIEQEMSRNCPALSRSAGTTA